MTPAQRPASRFFASFYRWSRYTQRSRLCASSLPCYRPGQRLPTSIFDRQYHATQLLHQQDQSQPRAGGTGIQAETEKDGTNETARQNAPGPKLDLPKRMEGIPIEVDEADVEAERLKQNVRQLMRNIPSSVAVITVFNYDRDLKQTVPMGVAVSSLSTVTLDPPLISFNIKQPSKTLDAIRAAEGRFRVHFPAGNLGGATMVDLFSRGNHPDAYNSRLKKLGIFLSGHDPTANDMRDTPSKAPKILNDRCVRAAMECTVTEEFSVADHVILVAKVDSMENKMSGNRTVLYVDGSYIRPDGNTILMPKRWAVDKGNTWCPWDHGLFPGEEHRLEYVEHLKTIIKTNPSLLRAEKEAMRELETRLSMSPSMRGVGLEQLIDECRREAGMPSKLPVNLQQSPVLSDFYGRLTPSDRSKIIERATKLAATNREFLKSNFRVFLQFLGVNVSSMDLLPSDIAEPLRAHGLLEPFNPRTQPVSSNRRDYTLQYLEQVEVRLVEHFASLGHEKAVGTKLDRAVQDIGESVRVTAYFKKARARLYAAASPLLYRPNKIDIVGEVSKEETRVIMSRVIRYMQVNSPGSFRKHIRQDPHEILRWLGIHPCITAFDVEFFFGKLRKIFLESLHTRDVSDRVAEMLQPWFDASIGWEDFETRVKSFVQKEPLRAMSWSIRDKLAAMGLSWEAVLVVSSSSDKQPLNGGQVLETLVAKELKALYGKQSEEVSQAIAQYLKQKYNFDVDPPASTSSAAKARRSSISSNMDDEKRVIRLVKY